jgi:cobyrinic acid a,c-diamide synthase
MAERHMGLVPPREHPGSLQAVADAARIAERYVDVDRLWEIACQARPVPWARPERTAEVKASGEALKPRIGVLRDSAFWFYYPDNLEALEMQGASLVECSALKDEKLPPVDALYIGGGFPETHAEALADNAGFRQALRAAVEGGLPVYAECGGLMYLGRELVVKDRVYPMAGVFDLQCLLDGRPQGHGYTILEADAPNPYFSPGEVLHGHEFHYSRVQHLGEKSVNFAFRVQRGCGIHDGRDGLCYRNVLATYSHIHAAGAKGWAKALWKQAVAFGERKKGHP